MAVPTDRPSPIALAKAAYIQGRRSLKKVRRNSCFSFDVMFHVVLHPGMTQRKVLRASHSSGSDSGQVVAHSVITPSSVIEHSNHLETFKPGNIVR